MELKKYNEFVDNNIIISKFIEDVEIKCGNMSDLNKISENLSYKKIIENGKMSIPFLLEKLNDQTCMFWIDALRKITGEYPDKNYIKTKDIKQAWLDWGTKNGYK
jgi:hypothetical protein